MSLNANPMDDAISTNAAWSVLFEVFSRIFSYPQHNVYEGLQNGQLLHLMQQCLVIIAGEHPIFESVSTLKKSLQQQSSHYAFEDLESDYIALFELNRTIPPLHMNAHLYEPKTYEQIELQQKLIALYLANGLEINTVEQADHLCVQLNFMAWLYQQLDLSGADVRKYQMALQTFIKQLLWVRQFAGQLEARQHWLYAPMGQLLSAVIDEQNSLFFG